MHVTCFNILHSKEHAVSVSQVRSLTPFTIQRYNNQREKRPSFSYTQRHTSKIIFVYTVTINTIMCGQTIFGKNDTM